MNGSDQNLPLGWHLDPDTGAWMRDTIHHMGRRCRNWDYRGRGVYLITIAAATRGSGIWGRVVAEVASDSALTEAGVPRVGVKEAGAPHVGVKEAGAPHVGVKEAGVPHVGVKEAGAPHVGVSPLAVKSTVKFRPNAIGRLIEAEWLCLAEAWPGVKLLAHQVMEDHFHGVIATPSFMQKPLGAIIGSFKARSSSAAGKSLWSNGNLLMLAPAAWPYLPGKKPITRIDACVLNRIAQLIAGSGATEIDYKGIRLEGVEEAMHRATRRME